MWSCVNTIRGVVGLRINNYNLVCSTIKGVEGRKRILSKVYLGVTAYSGMIMLDCEHFDSLRFIRRDVLPLVLTREFPINASISCSAIN